MYVVFVMLVAILKVNEEFFANFMYPDNLLAMMLFYKACFLVALACTLPCHVDRLGEGGNLLYYDEHMPVSRKHLFAVNAG